MGSVGVDSQGNMAVVYSASSTSIHPQVRYAGRLAGDPLGQLSQGEATLVAGTGSQTTYTRWGDYSAMGLDPDGCTFWFTTEYLISTGTNWQTRIGSFKFPGCGGGPTPTPTNTSPPPTATPPPTNTPTPNPSAAVHVSDLDGTGTPVNGGRWNALVTITVVDQNGVPVAGAVVTGSWSNGANGSGNCTTGATGQCTVSKLRNKNNVNSVTFTVTSVSASGYTYNSAANSDPDGDSNGTVIVVAKP
jgi:hypothetical protein